MILGVVGSGDYSAQCTLVSARVPSHLVEQGRKPNLGKLRVSPGSLERDKGWVTVSLTSKRLVARRGWSPGPPARVGEGQLSQGLPPGQSSVAPHAPEASVEGTRGGGAPRL